VGIAVKYGFGPHIGIPYGPSVEADEPFERRLRSMFEASGGVFVKVGQLLSTRSDLVPANVAAELTALQDHVPPSDQVSVRALIEAELEGPIDELFQRFDAEPLAAGSIAQVHAAVLLDGTEVVVKVQRPGIEAVVDRDIDVLLKLAEFAERRSRRGQSLRVLDLARELADRLRDELDFRIEAGNTEAVRRNLSATKGVRVPTVYASLSSQRVLTIEALYGASVRDLGDMSKADRDALADRLIASFIQQVMIDGLFNADPHPGNILVLAADEVGLIDFGAVGRLDALEQDALREMLLAVGRRDPERLLGALLDVAIVPQSTDLARFQRLLAGFLNRYLPDDVNPSAGAVVALLRLLATYDVVIPGEFVTAFRMFGTLQGTVETLSPGYLFTAGVTRIARDRLVRSRAAPKALAEVAQDELERWAPLARRIPRHLDRLATLAERGDFHMRVSLFSTDEDMHTVKLLLNRFVLGALGVGIGGVGAALLAIHAGPMLRAGVHLYSLVGAAALLLSLVLVLRVAVAVMSDGLN
jgi:ubiquinone biosynthesis protein